MQIEKYKRGTLVIVPITICIPYIFNITEYMYYYIVIGLLLSTLSIFCNFPIFINILHTRPVYYEDILLIDNLGNDPNYLQNIFLYVNGTATIIFIILSGIYFYRRVDGRMDIIESIGIFGGITIVYSKIQMYFGKGILSILFYIKNKGDTVEEDGTSHQSELYVDMPWLWCWCSQTQKCPMCALTRNHVSAQTSVQSSVQSSAQTSVQSSAHTSVLSLPNIPYTPRFQTSLPARQLNSAKPV